MAFLLLGVVQKPPPPPLTLQGLAQQPRSGLCVSFPASGGWRIQKGCQGEWWPDTTWSRTKHHLVPDFSCDLMWWWTTALKRALWIVSSQTGRETVLNTSVSCSHGVSTNHFVTVAAICPVSCSGKGSWWSHPLCPCLLTQFRRRSFTEMFSSYWRGSGCGPDPEGGSASQVGLGSVFSHRAHNPTWHQPLKTVTAGLGFPTNLRQR